MFSTYIYNFIQVANCGSFSKAYEKLYTSTVSIMKQINKLEDHVGVKLLERARNIGKLEQNIISIGTSILRPCNPLLDLWSKIDDGSTSIQFKIVPFEDDPKGLNSVFNSIGKDIDCFINPCSYSQKWLKQINIKILGKYKCCIAVSLNHRLAKKKLLTWADLDGENLLLIKRGEAIVIDQIRDDIMKNHPKIHIVNLPHFIDSEVFNRCSHMEYIIQTLDGWANLHPSLVTIPMDWNYEIPYGIIYSKKPSKAVAELIDKISGFKE